ncbi:molybdate ABC transporter substrate-binding protein [Nocardia sp. NPDC058705]|uniref:molybdate ABC transporter substrate-binding protein n=1 Tax=Nocardia sp. NPDC058705 TaxID=3346609 RepID=UPI0036AF9E0B
MIRRVALGAALVLLTVSACGSGNSDESTLTVFAAASLKSVFTGLEKDFESANPGVDVQFSFAGSSDLASQLEAGAPADVFASADQPTMDKAVQSGRITAAPVTFATNVLTLVTAPGNPKGINGIEDLADAALVVCAPQVPCGRATKKVADAAGTTLHPVSEESSVADVLTKVTSGQADAGFVYVTDAAGAGDKVGVVPVPEAAAAVNMYPIAVVADSKQAATAQKFTELVTGPTGRAALAAAGFGAP